MEGKVLSSMSSRVREAYTDTFEHSIDAKGRVTVPAEWRGEKFALRLCIVPSEEKCLKVYSAEVMAEKMLLLQQAPVNDPRRKMLERLASITQSVSIDAQGRVMVKDKLREMASLTKIALFKGAFDHFQIWDPGRAKEIENQQLTWEQVAREVGL
ncbi:MAG: division/cell wall cluster transcriptional repressor MraZ [Verrucomicrobiota bacterium]